VFEYLRTLVEQDVQASKREESARIELTAKKERWLDERLVEALETVQEKLNKELNVTDPTSRLYRIAHHCIYATDAEARAARTSKMNMIMHGDGHGGVHYHDGLVDINGLYEGRFDVVLTNPPFGSHVGKDQIIGATEQTRVETDDEQVQLYKSIYGDEWQAAHDRMATAVSEQTPILALFDIGRDPIGGDPSMSKVRGSRPTEQLFIERCLNLLKPGGRLGIVLPDGILNNPSLLWLRQYIEGRAQLLAVVSVPQEVFASSSTTVKTSLVFLRKFTSEQDDSWKASLRRATKETRKALQAQRQTVSHLARRATTLDRDDVASLVDLISRLQEVKKPDREALKQARTGLNKLLSPAECSEGKALASRARHEAKELDQLEKEMVRARTRELSSHPVFMAEAEFAGITSTGDTGPSVPNDLPAIATAYLRFQANPEAFATTAEAQAREAVAGAV
jgi:type I restriction enzyme M protein